MARAPIEIGIASETKAFKQGMEIGVIDPVEDAIDALDDLGKTRGPEDLERDLRATQKATEKLADETEETAESIERNYREAYRQMKQSSAEGTRRASADLQELGKEARSNAAETFSSFDGSAESFADGIQGTLGGIVSSLGPVGAAAGAIGAIGLGALTAGIAEHQKKLEELQGTFSGLYADATESGRAFLTEDQVIAEQHRLMWDDNGKTLEAIKADAETVGVSWQTMLAARAGDENELQAVIDATNAKYQERTDELNLQGRAQAGKVLAVDAEAHAVDQVRDRLQAQQEIQQRNKTIAEDELALKEKQTAATDQAKKADEERYTALAQALEKLPKSVDVPVTLQAPDTSAIDKVIADYKNKKIVISADFIDRLGRRVP